MKLREPVLAMSCALLVACSQPSGTEPVAPTTGATTSAAASESVWTNTTLKPISRVQNVAGVPIVLTLNGKRPAVVGLDPTSGKVAWTRDVTPSSVVPGIGLSVDNLDDRYVAYLEPVAVDPEVAYLVILDPKGAGTEVARSPGRSFRSFPYACPDDPGFVCIEAIERPGTRTFRFGSKSTQLEARGEMKPRHLESIGPEGLIRFTGAAQEQFVGVLKGTQLVWSKPESELFGAGFSTNGGWEFRHLEDENLIYGSVGADVDLGDHVQLKNSAVAVGFDARTGDPRWRLPSTSTHCDRDFTGTDNDPYIACEWTGGHTTVEKDARLVKPSIALARLDPATGKRLWRADVGLLAQTSPGLPELDLAGDTGLVVDTTTGPKLVALADGRMSQADKDGITWRTADVRFEGEVPWSGPSGTTWTRYGTVDEMLVGGEPAAIVSSAIPNSIGAQIGGLRVVADKAGVTAYRVQ